ncbi:MAG: flagellar hook-basal body protein [Deltaproteobacteria bacterium]|nr:MAG: flagellar hook-basal body protein [Deltaproteobacteria bacterium]
MILEMTRPVQGGLRQQRKLDVVSNHLANVNSNGFKKDILSFDETLNSVVTSDLTQGALRATDNPLDFALKDEGFFKIETPQGLRYTRDGTFTLDNDGFVVTQNGNPLLMGGAPFQVEGENIHVSEDGMVSVDGEEIGLIDIVSFEDKRNLYKDGSNLFLYNGNPADEIKPLNIRVVQGAVELSNVKPVMEMASMIKVSRTYETYEKMLKTFDEVDGLAVNNVGVVV